MKTSKAHRPILSSLLILIAGVLIFTVQAGAAENRLPANRTYLAFVQGLEDSDPFAGAFSCLVFTTAGKLLAGDDTGEWSINNGLSVSSHQRAITFEITVVDDEDGNIDIDALCWLDDTGARNTLTCSAHARVAGAFANFGLTARPVGGGASAAAQSSCQSQADSLNANL